MPSDDDLLRYIEELLPKCGKQHEKVVDICLRLQGLLREQKKAKLGRPRIGEARNRPWVEMRMSRRTWFRRQKELKT